jgi:hypothetical protein
MNRILPAVLLVACASAAHASQEGVLVLSSFRLESAGIGASGKIVVEGKQDEKGQVVSLKVNAFGKEYVVPKEKLAGLGELLANGIRISYEAGYAELGGRTVYIQLQTGFTSGTREQALVTVKENGKIEVGKVEKAEAHWPDTNPERK